MTLPDPLEAALDALGVRATPTTPKPKPTPQRPTQGGWRPSYPGEEPPF